MRAQDRKFMDLIQGTRQYQVPICQRPYEWDEERWEMLWTDLLKTKTRRQAQQHLAEDQRYRHFFASIVIRELGGTPVTAIDLIDGQQRMTTFMVLIKALADECAGRQMSAAVQGRLREMILNPEYMRDGQNDTKLRPGAWDFESFASVMGLGVGPAIPGRVRDAYESLRRKTGVWLDGTPAENREAEVLALLDAMQMGFAVALVTLDERDDYYEVFESLNGKHLELAESDKVRNYCFMMLSPLATTASMAFYRDEWRPMESRIAEPDKPDTLPAEFDRFLHYWTIMESGTQFGIDRLYHAFVDRLQARADAAGVAWERSVSCAQQVQAVARELIAYAAAYRAIRWPETLNGAESAVGQALARLTGDLNMKSSAHPLLLALVGRYQRSEPRDVNGLLACIQVIESFLIRRVICDVATNQHNRIAMELAHDLYTHGDLTLTDYAARMRTSLSVAAQTSDDRWPDDAEFEQRFATADFERQGAKRRFVKALLLEVERRRPGGAALSADAFTVEHILPDELTDAWCTHLGPDAERIHRDNLHRFGNLTILESSLQPQAGARLLADKKPVYRQSAATITRELDLQNGPWNEATVLARGNTLFESIRQIWPRPV